MPEVLLYTWLNNYFLCWTVRRVWRSTASIACCQYDWWYRHNFDFIANNSRWFTLLLRPSVPLSDDLTHCMVQIHISTLPHGMIARFTFIVILTNAVYSKRIIQFLKFSTLWCSEEALLMTLAVDICSQSISTRNQLYPFSSSWTLLQELAFWAALHLASSHCSEKIPRTSVNYLIDSLSFFTSSSFFCSCCTHINCTAGVSKAIWSLRVTMHHFLCKWLQWN